MRLVGFVQNKRIFYDVSGSRKNFDFFYFDQFYLKYYVSVKRNE